MKRKNRNRLLAAAVMGMASVPAYLGHAAPVTWSYTGALPGAWSTGGNWAAAMPTSGDDVTFAATGAAPAAGTVTNVVDTNFTINSLRFVARSDLGLFHTTQINSGVTLTVAQAAAGTALFVGSGADDGIDAQVTTRFTGPGTLAINNPGSSFIVRQTSVNAGLHQATLDLSGLSHFTANVSLFDIAHSTNNTNGNRATATVLLATDNTVTAGVMAVGQGASSNGAGTLLLGSTNVFNVGSVTIGERKQVGFLAFRSGVTNGSMLLRAQNGTDRVSTWLIGAQNATGENSATIAAGTVDFTAGSGFGAGSIDASIDNLILGRANGGTSLNTATGRVTYDRGVINANNVVLGTMNTGTPTLNHRGVGILEVKNTASLIVNSSVNFAQKNNSGDMAGHGTITIAGGSAHVFGDLTDGTNNSTGNGTVSANILVAVTNGASTSGSLTVNGNLNATGGSFTTSAANNSTFNIGGSVNMNQGTLVMSAASGGAQNITGSLNISGGVATLSATGARLGFGGTLTQSGGGSTSTVASASGGTFAAASVTASSGTVTLSATSSGTLQIGDLTANGGNIVVNTSTGGVLTGTTALAITNNGSVRAAKIGSSGSPLAATTFNNGSLTMDLGVGSPLPAAAVVHTTSLTADGTNFIGIASTGALAVGTFTAIDYTGSIGGGGFSSFSLAALPNRAVGELINNTGGTSIDVHIISGSDTPKWVGNVNDLWDINTSQNWKLAAAGTATKYLETGPAASGNDSVLFDDSATGTTTINIATTVTPNSVTFNNITKDYRLTGNTIVGGGTLTKNGAGRVTIANNNGNSFGTTALNAGTVTLLNDSSFGPMTVAAGARFEIGDGVTGGAGNPGAASVANSGVIVINRPDDFTSNLLVSGTGTILKKGTAPVTFSGVSTHSGSTVVEAGRALATVGEAFGGGGGSVTVMSGAAVDVNNGAANSLNFGTTQFFIAGDGPDGNGALTNSGGNAEQNAFQIVRLSADASIGAATSRFDIRGGQIGGPALATLDLAGKTLTKVGSNFLGLINTTITDGNLVVNGGIIDFERTTNVLNFGTGKSITLNTGATAQFFDYEGTMSRPITVNGTATMGNATNNAVPVASNITLNGDLIVTAINGNGTGSITLNGVISETGGPRTITKNNNGTGNSRLVLGGNNTFSGGVTINGGTVQVGNGATSGNLGTGPVVNNASLSFNRSDTASHANAISGSGGVFQNGSGTTVLTGANTYTGGTTVNAGALVAGNFSNGALTVNGGLARVSLKGTPNSAPGTSVVPALAIAATGATLDLTNNSMVIDYGDVGTLVADVRSHLRNGRMITSAASPANTRLGYADNAAFATPRSSFGGVSVDASSLLIKFTYSGDADLDGDADGVDIGTWATNFTGELSGGESATRVWGQGDWDYDGDVDGVDAGLWATAFTGELSGGGLGSVIVETTNPQAAQILQSLGITVVPEPSAVGLLGLCVAGGLARRVPRCRRGK